MLSKISPKLFFIATLLVVTGLWLTGQPGAVVAQEPTEVNQNCVACAIGEMFTHQGRIRKAGAVVDLPCDFQFSLFDSEGGGNQIGATQTVTALSVEEGLFSVKLNDAGQFGADAFTGQVRWLQTAVRCPAGNGNFTSLSPRQALTAVPVSKSIQPGAVVRGPVSRRGAFEATNIGPEGDGVVGNADDANGSGVVGIHRARAGVAPGVVGESASEAIEAVGVLGEISSNNAGIYSAGVRGVNNGTGVAGIGVYGSQNGGGWGVYGTTPSGLGVFGLSNSGHGVKGESSAGSGVLGVSTTGNGVHGTSFNNAGVFGSSVGGKGVSGFTFSGYAIYGESTDTGSFAGYFKGNVKVTGNLTKGGGSFKIDHPLDPAHKYLSHSFVESPDMMNIYNGNITLGADGQTVVELPAWFEALNQDFRYQLTPIGGPGPDLYIAQEIKDQRFTIAGGQPGLKVSWQVTGIRHDPYAKAYPIPVEEVKPLAEQGTYLYPELYGQPETLGVDYGQQEVANELAN